MGKKKATRKARVRSAKKGRESDAPKKQFTRKRTIRVTDHEPSRRDAETGDKHVRMTIEQFTANESQKRKLIREAYAEIEWWRITYRDFLHQSGETDALPIIEAIEELRKKKGRRWPKPKAPWVVCDT